MLASLKIENVAVIEKAEVNFTPGFNVLTGETGAGKSILIDSINAILGNRTSRELVRSGAQKACIWATFESIPASVKKQLEKCGYEVTDDLLLYREINAEGKGSCRVNGMPATAAVVRDISSGLLSIHGQHDSQSLTNPALHLGLLDQYAQNRDLFAEYYRRYRELVTVKRQLDALNASESDKQRRIEALTAEIDTIDAAALQPGEEKTLQERKNVITHAQSILAGITAAHLALAGDEDGEQAGAADLLGGAVDGLQNSARLDESLTAMSERLNDLYYSARELATDLADRLDAYGFDAGELDQIETRLDTIYRIKQKFGMEVDELLARRGRRCRAGDIPVVGAEDCRAESADADAVCRCQGGCREADPEPPERLCCHEQGDEDGAGISEHAWHPLCAQAYAGAAVLPRAGYRGIFDFDEPRRGAEAAGKDRVRR